MDCLAKIEEKIEGTIKKFVSRKKRIK